MRFIGSRFLLAFYSLVLALSASAYQNPDVVKDMNVALYGKSCTKQFMKTVQKSWAQNPKVLEWRRAASNIWGVNTFVSPTGKVGRWIQINIFPDGRLVGYFVTPLSNTELRMSGKACEPKFSKQNRILKTAEMKKGFTDADLMKLVESGEKGLIMAWSPHMPLSAEAIKEARAAAKALGMKFTLVLDPHADSSFAEKFRQENRMNTSAMRKIQSIDLIYRGIPNHYPVVVPYSDGKLSVNLIPGHSLKDRYVTLIKQSLQ